MRQKLSKAQRHLIGVVFMHQAKRRQSAKRAPSNGKWLLDDTFYALGKVKGLLAEIYPKHTPTQRKLLWETYLRKLGAKRGQKRKQSVPTGGFPDCFFAPEVQAVLLKKFHSKPKGRTLHMYFVAAFTAYIPVLRALNKRALSFGADAIREEHLHKHTQDFVDVYAEDPQFMSELLLALTEFYNQERITGKVSTERALAEYTQITPGRKGLSWDVIEKWVAAATPKRGKSREHYSQTDLQKHHFPALCRARAGVLQLWGEHIKEFNEPNRAAPETRQHPAR